MFFNKVERMSCRTSGDRRRDRHVAGKVRSPIMCSRDRGEDAMKLAELKKVVYQHWQFRHEIGRAVIRTE